MAIVQSDGHGQVVNADPAASLADILDGAGALGRGLPNRIADSVATAIIEGALEAGTRLSEPELAEVFGTSRTPVREALRLLERDQLVELTPRKGARVSAIDAQRAADLYVCRAYLYGLAAKLACSLATDNEVAELGQIVEEMGVAVKASDVQQYFRLNVALHERVTELADNGMLLLLIDQLGRATLRLRYLSLTIPGRTEASFAWHSQLIEAFRHRDPPLAERIVRAFIRDAGESVLRSHYENEERAMLFLDVLHEPSREGA